jgi:hypothetical protein
LESLKRLWSIAIRSNFFFNDLSNHGLHDLSIVSLFLFVPCNINLLGPHSVIILNSCLSSLLEIVL